MRINGHDQEGASASRRRRTKPTQQAPPSLQFGRGALDVRRLQKVQIVSIKARKLQPREQLISSGLIRHGSNDVAQRIQVAERRRRRTWRSMRSVLCVSHELESGAKLSLPGTEVVAAVSQNGRQ